MTHPPIIHLVLHALISSLIISREVEKVTAEKDNVTIIVRHNDYNPAPSSREHESFDVEYKCNWSPLMVKLQPLLIPNREALITGRIIGFSVSRNICFIPGDAEPELTQDPAPSSSKNKTRSIGSSETPRQYNKKSRGKPNLDDSLIDPA
ncbi:hypothetical protein DFH28DRAFT_921453 [Melampsora americana]|nr:hypothetical protein DFH28DRAFT_930368 [Melampsora americana]KAH9823944.1 hypothetical protein DFH28DRAFT_921453 [Melampsora americana]